MGKNHPLKILAGMGKATPLPSGQLSFPFESDFYIPDTWKQMILQDPDPLFRTLILGSDEIVGGPLHVPEGEKDDNE
jgi:hypothetical protein